MISALIAFATMAFQEMDLMEHKLANRSYLFVREVKLNNGADTFRYYERSSDGSTLTLQQSIITEPFTSESFMALVSESPGGGLPAGSLSGMPLGESTCKDVFRGGVVLHSAAGSSYAKAKITYGRKPPTETAKQEALALAEAIVRDRLALLLASGNDRGAETSRDLTSLSTLKGTKQWSVNVDDFATVATIVAGQNVVIAPLASNKISINGKWVDAGGFVLRRDNALALPPAAIKAIEATKS